MRLDVVFQAFLLLLQLELVEYEFLLGRDVLLEDFLLGFAFLDPVPVAHHFVGNSSLVSAFGVPDGSERNSAFVVAWSCAVVPAVLVFSCLLFLSG